MSPGFATVARSRVTAAPSRCPRRHSYERAIFPVTERDRAVAWPVHGTLAEHAMPISSGMLEGVALLWAADIRDERHSESDARIDLVIRRSTRYRAGGHVG